MLATFVSRRRSLLALQLPSIQNSTTKTLSRDPRNIFSETMIRISTSPTKYSSHYQRIVLAFLVVIRQEFPIVALTGEEEFAGGLVRRAGIVRRSGRPPNYRFAGSHVSTYSIFACSVFVSNFTGSQSCDENSAAMRLPSGPVSH